MGYGDLSISNDTERIICIFLMWLGVLGFTGGTSILTTLLENYDSSNREVEDKLLVLNSINMKYNLPIKVYERVKRTLHYRYNKANEELIEFIDELPNNLKLEVSMFIHENTYKKITFLKRQSAMFISWICPRLKPMIDSPGQYIYFEGDEVQCIYFLKNGKCGTVLPRHRNMKYIDYPEGCFFGEVDLVYESIE